MATVMAAKPSAPHQQGKIKRPPPPTVQTNGINSSQTSPSPKTASKRLPSASFKAPPTPTVNGTSGNSANGVAPRLSNRRRESQRPGESQGRNRSGKDGDRKVPKKRSEPYVKDQAYILKKYHGATPSLTIHLHKTLFRFDQQDGSFSYSSPMKFVLEHLKSQTIPHDMIEELNGSGIKFYEGCIIVQVKDHRNAKGEGNSSSSDPETTDTNKPFSIHNYSHFVTPSSYVPYPEQRTPPDGNPEKTPPQKDGQIAAQANGKQKEQDAEPKTFTVVLFPTPLSMKEEVIIQSNTPDTRPGNRKQGQSVNRTPASATVPHTPLSAVPPTPTLSGPQAKRQKMSIIGSEIMDFESKIITANAAPLFLEPAHSLEESHHIIDKLTDPLHREVYPAPKSRKRTVAELAADEAQAASDQAFMLIMDERLGPAMSANGPKAGTSADEAGSAPFEPRFEKFNAIQHIKAKHEQMARDKQLHDAEAKRAKERRDAEQSRIDQQDRLMQAQNEQQRRLHAQARNAELAKQQQRAAAAAQASIAAQNAAMAHGQMPHAHSNGAMNGMPHGMSQPQHSSPVVRNATPHSNPSPVVGSLGIGGVPMNVTSSGQGGNASSPQRPSSAIQQNAAAQAMHRQQSRQQAMPNRTGTPHVNGTPTATTSTPAMGHVTPTPRMPQSSPTNPGMVNMMPNGNMMPQIPNGMPQHMNPQQQQQWMEMMRRRQTHQQQTMLIQQQQQQGGQQSSPTNPQIPPEHRAAMANLSTQQQLQRQQLYQQQLAAHHANHAMQNGGSGANHGHPGQMPNAGSPQAPQTPQPGHPQQAHPQQMPQQQRQPVNPAQMKQMEWQRAYMQRELQQVAAQKYGGNLGMLNNEDKTLAQQHAAQAMQALAAREKQKAQHNVQQQRQHQAMLQNMQNLQQMQGGAAGMAGMARGGGGGGASGGGGANSGMTPQHMMAQMVQMPQMGGQGMGGMGGMNMNVNGMGMGMNGMGGGMGNGMGGMQ